MGDAQRRFPCRTLLVCAALFALLLLAASPRVRGLLANSGLLLLGVWAISLPLGALLGTFLAKVDAPGRTVLRWLLVAMLFIPLYVYAGAWQSALGFGGWANNWLPDGSISEPWLQGWRAAIWIHGAAAVPWAALLTAAALASVERPLEEQSLLDATGWRVLARVSLPRGASGLFAAAVWIAAICTTEIAVTDLFQVRTFAEEAYVEASLGGLTGAEQSIGLSGSDFAIGVLLLIVAMFAGVVVASPWLPAAAGATGDDSWVWRPRRVRWLWSLAALIVAAAVFAVPIASLIWKAGLVPRDRALEFSATNALQLTLHSPWAYRREWVWSLMTGVAAATVATMLALGLAWLVRMRPVAERPVLAIAATAAAIPAPLVGVAVIWAMNHPAESPLAPITKLYDYTVAAPIVVQSLRALPLATVLLWSQLATIPASVLEAARSEGAGWLQQLGRIAVPMRAAPIASCFVAAILIAVAEVSATILVSPPGATMLSVRIFGLLHYGADDQVAALCLSVVASLGMVSAVILFWRAACRRRQLDRIESGQRKETL